MKIALTGLPKSGKTTLFNALTGASANTDKYAPNEETNIGVVQVPDARIDQLSQLYKPKKTIYAQIEYRDYPGIFSTKIENGDNVMINDIKSCEGFALVLRNFEDEELEALIGPQDPLRDLQSFEEEMILNDLILAENRLQRIELSYKRGVKTAAIQLEERLLNKVVEHLKEGLPLRSMQLAAEEERAIRGFQFFSQKPLFIVLNSAEQGFGQQQDILQRIEALGFAALEIAASFEEELSKLEPSEALVFMEDMGISGSIRDRLIQMAYQMMGYISFFTVGSDEVRAWTVFEGDNALTAAGKVHSDLARGFIRAECFNVEDLLSHGSEKALREKGLFRLEGKEYIVRDGDVIFVRFNV